VVRGRVLYALVAAGVLGCLAAPYAAFSDEWSSLVAWLLTFPAGAVVVGLAGRFADASRSNAFVLLSTAFRMTVAGLGAWLSLSLFPSLPRESFLLWLGVMYLLALGVEVCLTMSTNSLWTVVRRRAGDPSPASHLTEMGR